MQKMTFREQVFYGMGGLSMMLPDMIFMQWLVYRFVPPDPENWLVPKGLFGAFVLLARFSEGVICPTVGYRSDKLTHRWGRRLPFMRIAALPMLAAFFLVFMPPAGMPQWLNLLYAVVLVELYLVCYNSIFTPYLSLMPELATTVNERINTTTTQAVFMLMGFLFFALMGMALKNFGWAAAVGMVIGLTGLFLLPALLGLRERPRAAESQEHLPFWSSVRLAFANRPFRRVVGATAAYFFMVNGMLLLLPYWAVCVLHRTEEAVTILMLPYLAANLVFFFVFNALSRRYGKYPMMLAMFAASGLFVSLVAAVGHIPWGTPFQQTFVAMGLIGCATAGFMVLPFAALADAVDYDEHLTGRRREAIFFGLQAVVQKAVVGVSVMAATIIPYIGGEGKISSLGLRLMALACAAACLLSFVIFLGYPIREKDGKLVFPED